MILSNSQVADPSDLYGILVTSVSLKLALVQAIKLANLSCKALCLLHTVAVVTRVTLCHALLSSCKSHCAVSVSLPSLADKHCCFMQKGDRRKKLSFDSSADSHKYSPILNRLLLKTVQSASPFRKNVSAYHAEDELSMAEQGMHSGSNSPSKVK